MSSNGVSGAYESLRQVSQQRLSSRDSKTRVTVQVAHCSQSVGANDVADALTKSLSDESYLVIAGCDGACYNAPQVIVTSPSGDIRRYTRVTPDSITTVLNGSESGSADAEAGEDAG